MAGKHRAKKRQPEAYVWLGTGAMTLGLGVALAAGSGVAQADTTNASVGGSARHAVAGEFRSDDFYPYDHQRAERKYVNQFIHARGCGRRKRDIDRHYQRFRCPTNGSGGYR